MDFFKTAAYNLCHEVICNNCAGVYVGLIIVFDMNAAVGLCFRCKQEVNDQMSSKKYKAGNSAKLCSSTMSTFMMKKELNSD